MGNGGESGEHMAGSEQRSSLWDGYGSPEFKAEDEPEAVDWNNIKPENMPRGLPLVRLCLSNVLKDMEIVGFQAISLFVSLAFLGLYLTWVLPTEDWETTATILGNPIAILILYPYFIVAVMIVTYFRVACVGVATMRLQGKNPTFRDGLRIANSRLFAVIEWAFISASVGIVFAFLKRSKNPGAKLVGTAGEIGWAVANYFIVPVMIFERIGPIDAIHESASLVRRTWKTALVGNFGMSTVFFVLALPSFLVLAITASQGALWVGIGFFITYLLILSVFSGASHTVLLSALYLIATGGKPKDFAAYPDVKESLSFVDSWRRSQKQRDEELELEQRRDSLLMRVRH
jgi:hypothetical protein